MARPCECPVLGEANAAYHGGSADACPREAADHSPVIASPALCTACLFGCGDEL